MSFRSAKWKCSLEPLARLPEKIPSIPLPFPSSKGNNGDVVIQDSRPVNVAHFQGLDKHSDLEGLITGYSRWIMTITKLDHIAFAMTEYEKETLKSAVISVQGQVEDGSLRWQAYEKSLDASGLPVGIERLDFGLCLRYNSGNDEILENMVSYFICRPICIPSVN